MRKRFLDLYTGKKNGSPWMWSLCVCPMNKCALSGPDRASSSPSFRAPVPQSKISSVPSSARASTHGVFAPYRYVSGPGAAIEPRVPQKRTRIVCLRTLSSPR